MASALLASRNEPYWGERKVYMKRNSNSNPSPRFGPNHNPNPSRVPHPRGGYGANHEGEKEDAPAVAGPAMSQDSTSFNWNSANPSHRRDAEVPGAPARYVTFNISALSKKELRELKRKLVSELEQVRNVTNRIESREFQSSARSVGCSASATYCSSREVTSPAALQQKHHSHPESLGEREARVSEAKMLQLLPSHNRESLGYPTTSFPVSTVDSKNLLSGMMKKCTQILGRLMRHKGGRWFNSPVDVQGMGLHDYRLIIKHPMDLGTVKSKLTNDFYKSPLDFAEDIRLTFNNALIYNPEAHEVHKLAALLLRQFESLFSPAYTKFEQQLSAIASQGQEKKFSSALSQPAPDNPFREDIKQPQPLPQPVQFPVTQQPIPVPQQLVPVPPQRASYSKPVDPPPLPSPHQQQQQYPSSTRVIGTKLPKPKARDPNKRPMSYEERQKLSSGLQSLPEEKMGQVLQIVKRRNVETQEDGDEIVLDFETMDIETLWELDRFVYNCKKMLSKLRRQEAMTGNIGSAPNSSAAPAASLPADADHKNLMVDDGKRSKRGDPVEEDVDIGEEMTSTNYPSVEIEKDDGYASSSSSSGSDSSSSSDSDSGSSSGSDSDEDAGRSPVRGAGSPPRG